MYVARYPSHKVQEATRRELGYQDVKPEQMKVVEVYVQVFAVLPTGYGKSLCYGCLSFLSYSTTLKATVRYSSSRYSLIGNYGRSGKHSAKLPVA